MATTDRALIKPLVEQGIVRDGSALEKAVLDYVDIVRRLITNFDDVQKGVMYTCAWFAVE